MKQKLIIFVKNAIPGTAKTRIGRIKGDDVAMKVYQRLLTYTRDLVKDLQVQKIVFYNKYIEHDGFWANHLFSKKLQVEGDLGQKMAHAFFNEFNEKVTSVVIIGSDCAELKEKDVKKAFQILENKDVVIGPAQDGGYYLLGMNEYYPELFEDKPWSQEDLLKETLATLDERGLTYELLDEKSDIDYWEDWIQLGWPLE
ncbi:TIGR04282 family arsenosugar biosynthesis glycosyltransferase [Portibacter marinus]|uniref:TIGR04282 family arsenosugar biosynthesis glycosyltransferase n=1 Tax=Portibacter marinus TaxID=2898660 RepID=UPI001F00E15E|nr:TIGR04282 family arsenosugar biosynthesis glycosyltransferase [Portibacter marinus]